MKTQFDIECIKEFLFEQHWMEVPLYYNNFGYVIRFDLRSKSASKNYKLVNDCLSDLFVDESYMMVIFNCCDSIKPDKKYFMPFTLKKLFKYVYISKDKDDDSNPYVVAYLTKRKYFKSKKYFDDYFSHDRTISMFFYDFERGALIDFYDARGFDIFSEDKDFLRYMFNTYEQDIIDYNKDEMRDFLSLQDDIDEQS